MSIRCRLGRHARGMWQVQPPPGSMLRSFVCPRCGEMPGIDAYISAGSPAAPPPILLPRGWTS